MRDERVSFTSAPAKISEILWQKKTNKKKNKNKKNLFSKLLYNFFFFFVVLCFLTVSVCGCVIIFND